MDNRSFGGTWHLPGGPLICPALQLVQLRQPPAAGHHLHQPRRRFAWPQLLGPRVRHSRVCREVRPRGARYGRGGDLADVTLNDASWEGGGDRDVDEHQQLYVRLRRGREEAFAWRRAN